MRLFFDVSCMFKSVAGGIPKGGGTRRKMPAGFDPVNQSADQLEI